MFKRGDTLLPRFGRYPQDALTYIGKLKTGEVELSPKGGGRIIKVGPAGVLKLGLRKVDAEKVRKHWRQVHVRLEDMGDRRRFKAWWDGRRWNGWVVPMFELDEAKRVARYLSTEVHTIRFSAPEDSFIDTYEDGSSETTRGVKLSNGVHAYVVADGVTWSLEK